MSIEFGVDGCCLQRTVPQDVCDLFERRTLPNHLRGCRVAKMVCSHADAGDPGFFQNPFGNSPNLVHGAKGRNRAQKDRAVGTGLALLTQIADDRRASIFRQRQASLVAGLAQMNTDHASSPVNIFQLQLPNFTRPHSEACHEKHHRAIAKAEGGIVPAHGEHAVQLLGREVFGQGCVFPIPDDRNRSSQIR